MSNTDKALEIAQLAVNAMAAEITDLRAQLETAKAPVACGACGCTTWKCLACADKERDAAIVRAEAAENELGELRTWSAHRDKALDERNVETAAAIARAEVAEKAHDETHEDVARMKARAEHAEWTTDQSVLVLRGMTKAYASLLDGGWGGGKERSAAFGTALAFLKLFDASKPGARADFTRTADAIGELPTGMLATADSDSPKPTAAERAGNKALARDLIRHFCPKTKRWTDAYLDDTVDALWLEAVLHEHVVKMRGMT